MAIGSEDSGLAEFLKDPERLQTAYDLVSIFPDVIDEIENKFWSDLHDYVSSGIPRPSRWNVNFFKNSHDKDYKIEEFPLEEQWAGLKIKTPDHSALSCCFAVERCYPKNHENAGLYYGVRYSRKIRRGDVSVLQQHAQDLMQRLCELGWEDVPEPDHRGKVKVGDWWIGNSPGFSYFSFCDLGRRVLDYKAAIRILNGELQKEVGKALLELFKKEYRAVENINGALQPQG